ncbi:MAG: glycosyltransferase family 39 protein [Flavobacteriaceae bacterium]|nr:glycosyltransferase family 39 protein [Flavobacteriaceae bacterium]
MKIFKSNKSLFVFYIILFFTINILQSTYTELIDDEAYYWLWSKDLAWGYFDHPPMVALWIKFSGLFFNGELGVRFFSAFMFSFTLILIWKLIDIKSKWENVSLFFLLITAVILFNFYGFITVPDTPLFFFSALFLYAYKLFLRHENIKIALLMGFAMAGMLYSKYHGVLVIGFVVLSDLSLLKKRYFWMASLFAFVLFTPHIWWQYDNGFPTILYHLNRSKKLYRLFFSVNHILNQLLIVGLAFPVLYYAFFKGDFKNKFNRALLFILVGFIGFFFISTFKTSTQPQWTSLILIPLIVISFPYLVTHQKVKKRFIVLASLNLIALFYIRFSLADENFSAFKWETHQNKAWAQRLKENTEGLPIVFHNSFQNASKYIFYTGIEAFSYNSLYYRQNQFDLPGFENILQGKTIYEVSNLKHGKFLSKKRNKIYYGTKIENYTTFQRLKCTVNIDVINLKLKDFYDLTFELVNPYTKAVPVSKIEFYGVFQTKKHQITDKVKLNNLSIIGLDSSEFLAPLTSYKIKCHFAVPKNLDVASTTFRVALGFNNFPPGFEGNPVEIDF